MKLRIRTACCLLITGCWLLAGAAAAQNGVILDQDLDDNNQGYTVMRVWGSHYEMGYAQASLLGDYIVDAVAEVQEIAGSDYDLLRNLMKFAIWQPPEIEDEIDGMVASLAVTHPSAAIDELDLKVINTYGDWGYACRSHMCWGRYVAPPIKTLATRRLDFGAPALTASHHVLLAWDPDDGSPQWVNLAWPGAVAVVTGVNEFGSLASLHDYDSYGADLSLGRMPRVVAARYALTLPTSADLSTHLTQVFSALQPFEIMTRSFINYYAPEGYGGVITADPYQAGSDFYDLRKPKAAWHHGEAMITTNRQTDGTYTPVDEDFGADDYYDVESPKTLESHWDLLASRGNSLHQMSVAYRGRGDMTLWADGRIDPPHGSSSRTPRLELEWQDLFPPQCRDGINNDPGQDPDPGLIDFDGGQSIWGACTGQTGGCPANVSDPEGDGVANPDPQCVDKPWKNNENTWTCGLGAELALLLPPLIWFSARRRRRA
jgi:hypothetical protein